MNLKSVVFGIVILVYQAWTINSQCKNVSSSNGAISDKIVTTGYNIYRNCWKIAVPSHHVINATIELSFYQYMDCDSAHVEIKMDDRKKILCSPGRAVNEMFSSNNDSYFEINFFVKTGNYANREFSFRLTYLLGTINSQCKNVSSLNGTISDSFNTFSYYINRKCWNIAVAADYLIKATVELSFYEDKNCNGAYVEIKMNDVRRQLLCRSGQSIIEMLFVETIDSNFEINFYVDSEKYANGRDFSFRLTYFIRNSDNVLENTINWLKKRHNTFWGWKEDTPRAVTAVYLAGGAQFNGTLIEEMMAKQAELRTALALTWNSVSIERLSTFINALLTTCLKPRHFYGHDLVTKLKKQVESSGNFTHPAAYLALCNANESWPDRSVKDLSYILSSKSDYRFIRDFQAFAIMALSCDYSRGNPSSKTENDNLKSLYSETVKRMKKYQKHDGSFGNSHTTALITQALMASGQEFATDWRPNDNFRYLENEMNSSDVNFLTVYATLPLLNRKTLKDIAHVNCSKNPRFEGEDPASELEDYQGPKIRVQYSLYIGDQKDVIHTISLRVPKNSTAYTIMQFAVFQDKKYKFKMEIVDNVKHVYEIAGIPNDPEDGKFWLLYVKRSNIDSLSRYTSNPERLILEDGEELVMWYETQKI